MNIEDKIREFIIKNLYYAEGAALSDDASFLAEGVIDSMGAMELVAFVESEFNIKVEMSEVIVKNFDSIAKMANFVRRKLGIPEEKPVEIAAQLREEVATLRTQ
jgi:acyl carrier protein